MKTVDIVGSLVNTDDNLNIPVEVFFSIYSMVAIHVLRQKREEKYKGLQHD